GTQLPIPTFIGDCDLARFNRDCPEYAELAAYKEASERSAARTDRLNRSDLGKADFYLGYETRGFVSREHHVQLGLRASEADIEKSTRFDEIASAWIVPRYPTFVHPEHDNHRELAPL